LAQAGPVGVAHVVDHYNRYPGETVTFFTRLAAHAPAHHLTLRILLPHGLTLTEYWPPPQLPELMPVTEVDEQNHYLVWEIKNKLPANTRLEFRAAVAVAPINHEITLTGQATVTGPHGEFLEAESVSIAVWPSGKYLTYLPALYEQDDFMGRFLMLFESFWKPIETQIDGVYNYFDPRLTPAHFLPWLASWLDIELEEHWSLEQQRRLLRWAIALHRSRGTRWGLLKYLELYTGQTAEIVEQRAENFILGEQARLGPGIALGQGNVPHTFTVTLRLPPVKAGSAKEQKRLEEVRHRAIEAIIDRQKPAHTVYTLHLEPLEPEAAKIESAPVVDPSTRKKNNEIAAQAAIWFKLDE
jgi:phage tail-like protein